MWIHEEWYDITQLFDEFLLFNRKEVLVRNTYRAEIIRYGIIYSEKEFSAKIKINACCTYIRLKEPP